MEIQEYFSKMKDIQRKLLLFIDDEYNDEENYQNIISFFQDHKIKEDLPKLKSILHFISKISNHHYKTHLFYNKIDRILSFFKSEIKQFYSNYEIFNIFRHDKRILLFLIEEKILIFDQSIANCILSKKYSYSFILYFLNEIQPFINKKLKVFYQKEFDNVFKGNQNQFEEKRRIGENEDQLYQLIKNDKIEEFITYVNKTNLPLSSSIKRSIFETNIFLIKNIDPNTNTTRGEPTLIEYASFYGSIQIFKYLHLNGVELDSSLWLYAIHGKDPELIQILEENNIKPVDEISYMKWIKESIKCHHNEIIDYIQNNYSKFKGVSDNYFICESHHYYNFASIENFDVNFDVDDFDSYFFEFCENDYISIVDFLLKNKQIDINVKRVFIKQKFNII